MADKDTDDKDSCCGSGRCGGKAIGLILLLIGGIVGYLIGGHCAYRKGMCPIAGTMSTPASTPQK